jgi:hypothetical protein
MKQLLKNFAIKDPSRYEMFEPVSFIRRGSTTTKSVLHYLKMKRGVPVSALNTRDMFPKFFGAPVDAKRILATLERRGFAKQAYKEAWVITAQGQEAVGLLAQRDRLLHCDAND